MYIHTIYIYIHHMNTNNNIVIVMITLVLAQFLHASAPASSEAAAPRLPEALRRAEAVESYCYYSHYYY